VRDKRSRFATPFCLALPQDRLVVKIKRLAPDSMAGVRKWRTFPDDAAGGSPHRIR
jgi:hypothetical protein